ncbi:uncharacterized protein LOC133805717 [Humulus lupulus]|uniref:uncharacterized protein LOC133805717 n=1 Tax=Humulus lupulus TaxID=3486 RepID=UPI002B41191F|nr:uncharacterized protein LOC133805717 [Humulus lupulus]
MADDGKTDPHSPYYLGSMDQPGNMITHVILSNDNYIAWARAIKLSLKARRKFVFVDGTITKPVEKKKQLDWETVNSMLVSWITRTLDPKLAASIPFHDEAKRLWDYLEKHFCVANDRLKPLHACECGHCTCDVAGRFVADREEEKLHQFLIGIDDELYATVCSNLLSTSPPPDLDCVYQACLQEERSRGIAHVKADKEDIHAFALQTARPKDRNHGAKGTTRSNVAPPPVAPPAAPRGRPKLVATNVVAAPHVATGGTDPPGSSRGTSLDDLKPEQMMGESSSLSWIIDNGASHHITGTESCLIGVHNIAPCSVGLPDGVHAVATKAGRVLLADGLILEHDLRSGSLIGAGERKDGLYYFQRIPTVCVVTVPKISDFELWHRRLGHPSDRFIKLVPAISFSTSRNKLNKACDVCPQAKQKRGSFPCETNVKIVRSDNGTEFKCMLDYFDANGIIFQTSCVGTPQQNGCVEHKHQHILNVGRALMFQRNLPITWRMCAWCRAPDFYELKVFGCLAFAYNQKAKDVKFHENEFPYATVIASSSSPPDSHVGIDVDFLDDLESVLIDEQATPAIGHDSVIDPTLPPAIVPPHLPHMSWAADCETSVPLFFFVILLPTLYNLRVLLRVHRLLPAPHFSPRHRVFLAAITTCIEPRSFKEAMQDEGWHEAMQKEIAALEANGTWEMTVLPPHKKALGSKWVYKIKYHADGQVECLKARLIVFGNRQLEGVDYNETFAPVAKMVTVRTS